jgi:hypothetical protein
VRIRVISDKDGHELHEFTHIMIPQIIVLIATSYNTPDFTLIAIKLDNFRKIVVHQAGRL